MEEIIVKNLIDSEVFLEDLGISVLSFSSRNIGEIFQIYQLKCSNDLKTGIENDMLILNDGTKDLSKVQSLAFFGI